MLYVTVILSDQPIAQREGMPGVIETQVLEDPEAADITDCLDALGAAAIVRWEVPEVN